MNKTSTIWLNQMHASQRDVAELMRNNSSTSVKVVSSHASDREDIFMTADEFFIEPCEIVATNFDYVDWALEMAACRKVDGLLGTRCRTQLIAARDKFTAIGVRLAAGATDAATIDLCDHKDRFTVAMQAAGLPVAETVVVDDPAALKEAVRLIGETGTGVCVKPAVGVYGRGFWRFTPGLNPFTHFSALAAREVDPEVYLEAYAKADNHLRLIVMQYLPGTESSIDCVCDNGVVAAHAVRQKDHDRQTVFTSGREAELARAVAAELGLDGLVNIQTREDGDGNPVLLEVNTRPSGGVGYPAAAGVNLPLACARMMLGERVGNTSLASPVAIRRSDVARVLPRATEALSGRAA